MSDEQVAHIYVSADQVLVEDGVAVVSMSFSSMEDMTRRFLRTVCGEETGEADE